VSESVSQSVSQSDLVHISRGGHLSSCRMGTGVKRREHVAAHSASSSAKVKNSYIYTSTPPYVLMAWFLIRHRHKTASNNGAQTRMSELSSSTDFVHSLCRLWVEPALFSR